MEQGPWCSGALRQILGAVTALWAQKCWDCRAPGEPAPRGPLREAPPLCRLARPIRRHDLSSADHLRQPLPLR